MKPGIRAMQAVCECGKKFLRSSSYPQDGCPSCRSRERRHFQDRSGKGSPKAPPLTPEQRIEAHWRRWLLAQLEPFLGQTTVNVNALILHLREAKSSAA